MTFDPKTACNQALVTFNVTHPFGTSFQVDFGDGNYSDTLQQPTFQHFYSSPTFVEPAIILKDSTGCQVYFGGFGLVDIKGAVPIFGIDKKRNSVIVARYILQIIHKKAEIPSQVNPGILAMVLPAIPVVI